MTTQGQGVVHAATASGELLPVIDVTNPAFKADGSPEAIERLRRDFAALEAQRKRMPKFLVRFFMRSAAKHSLLLRTLIQPQADVLDGLSTYVFKLGIQNLPPRYHNKFDRRLAESPMGKAMSLRVQQTAQLIAHGVRKSLEERPEAPLYLINIAGGSAIDSLNALILLRAASARLLSRQIVIHVLDPDDRGPFFGQGALAALSTEGQPLAGLGITWLHDAYDWNDTKALEKLLQTLAQQSMIVAASSEGGLFEYGSDQAIVANLQTLYANGHGAVAVAGSVTRADELTRDALALSLFKLIPRGVEGFSTLIRDTGYAVTEVAPGLMGDQVLLTRTSRSPRSR